MFPKINNKRVTIEELEAVLGWEEDEHPRDDKGQFVSGPGSEGAEEKSALEAQDAPEEIPDYETHTSEAGYAQVSDPSKAMDEGLLESRLAFQNSDGSWKDERKPLHDQITKKRYLRKDGKQLTSPRDKGEAPVFYMLGGGPASGKSSILKTGKVQIDPNHVEINVDDLKEDLPEVDQMKKDGDQRWAPFAHEESSYLGKEIIKEAYTNGHNFVLDGTGDGGEGSFMKRIKQARENGYRINANYVTIPTDVAIERSAKRAEKGQREGGAGRNVPVPVIASIHSAVSRMFKMAIEDGVFDEAQLWDNSGSEPKLILSHNDGETQIHEQDLWDSFVAKGSETWPKKNANVKRPNTSQPAMSIKSSLQQPVKQVVHSTMKNPRPSMTKLSSGSKNSPRDSISGWSTTELLPWHHGLKQAEMPYYKNRDKLRKERDDGDHSCSKCGAKSNLQIHHKDGNAQNDSSKNVEYLCASCHTSHEWENGKTMPSKKSAEWPGASTYDPNGDILDDYTPDMQRTYPEDSGLPGGEDEIQQLAAALMYGLQQSGSLSLDQAKMEIEQMIPMDASADDIINWGVENGLWVSDGMQIRLASIKEAGGLDWVVEKISSLLIQFMEGLARDAIKKMIPDAEGGIVDKAIDALVESGQATEDWDGISLTDSGGGGDDPFFAMGAVKDMSQSDAQDTLDGMGGRHKTCVEQAPDNIDDPEAWCASIVDEAEGTTYWRGKGKKHEGSYIDRYYEDIDDFLPVTAAGPQIMDDAWNMWISLVTTQGVDRDKATKMVADNYGIDLEEFQAYIKENEQFRFAKKQAEIDVPFSENDPANQLSPGMRKWIAQDQNGIGSDAKIFANDIYEATELLRGELGSGQKNVDGSEMFASVTGTWSDGSEVNYKISGGRQGESREDVSTPSVVFSSKKAETGSEELVDSLDEGQIQDELDERSETEGENVKREVEGAGTDHWTQPWYMEEDKVPVDEGGPQMNDSYPTSPGSAHDEFGMPIFDPAAAAGGEEEETGYVDGYFDRHPGSDKPRLNQGKLAYDDDSFFDMPSGMNDADMEMQGLEDAGAEYLRGKNAYQPGMPKPENEGRYFLEGWADAELMYSDYSQPVEEDYRAESIDQFASRKIAEQFMVGDGVENAMDGRGVIEEVTTDLDGETIYVVDLEKGETIEYYGDEISLKEPSTTDPDFFSGGGYGELIR